MTKLTEHGDFSAWQLTIQPSVGMNYKRSKQFEL